MEYEGNMFLIIGILIIFATLYIGYNLYENIQLNNIIEQTSPTSTSSTSTINSTLNNMNLNINETIKTSTNYLIEIMLLFLFASIGYKIAYLGITINKGKSQQAPGKDGQAEK